MTEFEAAHAFVTEYAEAVAVAIRAGDELDDRTEFLRWCDESGVEPTPERLALALDVAAVASEYFAGGEWCYWEGDEDGPQLDPEDLADVPALHLADGLECRGWRLGFLDRDVRG